MEARTCPPPLRSMIATTFTPKPPISGSSPSVHPALTIERWCRPRWPRRCTWVPPNQLAASSLFTSCGLHSLIHFDVDEVLILNNHECRNVEHTSWKHSLLFSLSPAVSLFMRSGPHPPFASTLRSNDSKLAKYICFHFLVKVCIWGNIAFEEDVMPSKLSRFPSQPV